VDEERPSHIKLVTDEPKEEKVEWPCPDCGHSIDFHVGGERSSCFWGAETHADNGLIHTVVRSFCTCQLPPSYIARRNQNDSDRD
jgi:hypothetical protein